MRVVWRAVLLALACFMAAPPAQASAGTSDLAISAQVTSSSGENRTIEVVLTNHGPDAAQVSGFIAFYNTFSDVEIVSESLACAQVGTFSSPRRCSIGDSLAAGGSRTLVVNVRIVGANPSFEAGTNTQYSSGELTDPDFSNNGVNVPLAGAGADLEVQVAAPASPRKPGVPFSYRVTVKNHGPGAADAAALTASIEEQAVVLGAVGAQCDGMATLSCSLGTLTAGSTASFRIVAVPRHPAASAFGPQPPDARAALAGVKKDNAAVDATVSSAAPDANTANNSGGTSAAIRARTAKPPAKAKRRTRVRKSAFPRMEWGWWVVDGYGYGSRYLRSAPTGYKYGLGGFTVAAQTYHKQSKQVYGIWPQLWAKVEYRVRIAALSWTGSPTWSTVFPNGSGAGYGSGGTFRDPSWKVDSAKVQQSYIWFVPGTSYFALRTPNQRYILEGRFRFYKSRIRLDKVHDTGWVFMDAQYSGQGY